MEELKAVGVCNRGFATGHKTCLEELLEAKKYKQRR